MPPSETTIPINPPDFARRVPYGYHDRSLIRADLEAAGFGKVMFETVTRENRATSARDAVAAMIQGSPLRMELVARDPDGLDAVMEAAEAALHKRFGDDPIVGKLQAVVVVARE